MTVTGYMFESGPLHMTQAYNATTNCDWITDVTAGNVHAILTNTSPATHYTDWVHYGDVSGELATGGGYTNDATGTGKALGTPTVTVQTDTDRYIVYSAANLVWAAPFTAGPFQYIIILKWSGATATSPILAYVNLGAATTGGGGAFEYDFVATTGGVFRSKIPHA
jgi:hypothetical protein